MERRGERNVGAIIKKIFLWVKRWNWEEEKSIELGVDRALNGNELLFWKRVAM